MPTRGMMLHVAIAWHKKNFYHLRGTFLCIRIRDGRDIGMVVASYVVSVVDADVDGGVAEAIIVFLS